MTGISFEKIFQSVGKMTVTMISMCCGCITNIILDPFMIFGLGPFPAMGITGAALATGIGQTVTLVIYLLIFILRPLSVHIHPKYWKADKKTIGKLYAIGIPATLNMALPSLLISLLNAILAAYSEVYILVLGIYYKLQTFLYLPANGIIQGMRPVIGFNYGAKEHKRVQQIYRIVLIMNGMIMLFGTIICLVIPNRLIGLFTTNPGYDPYRADCTSYHQSRFSLFYFFDHRIRCIRRIRKRNTISDHIPLPLSSFYHSGSFYPVTSVWSCWCMACVLDCGTFHCICCDRFASCDP